MARVAFFPLAVDPGAARVLGRAAVSLLSRQIPRLGARTLSGPGREARFFPFVRREGGAGEWVAFADQPEPAGLGRMAGPFFTPEMAVDGRLDASTLTVRVVQAAGGAVAHEAALALDPGEAAQAAAAWIREAALGSGFDVPAPPWASLPAATLLPWLHAEDAILSFEADLPPGDPHGALAALGRALAELPAARLGEVGEPWESLLELGRRCLQGGALPETVRRALEAAASRAPAEPGVLAALGGLLEEAFGPAAGLAALERLVALPAAGAGDLVAAALGARQAGEERLVEEALRRLHEAGRTGVAPEQAVALAALLNERGRARRALAVLEGASDPGVRAGRCLEEARARLLLGEAGAAREALARIPADAAADLRVEAGRLAQLARHPGLAEELRQARHALDLGDARSALGAARRAVGKGSALAEAWWMLGRARHRLGHRRRAARALRRALALDEDLAEARDLLGIVLVGLGRFEEAYRELFRAAGALPGRAGPMAHLAQACHYLGRRQEGMDWLRRAEQAAPGDPVLGRLRERFYPSG